MMERWCHLQRPHSMAGRLPVARGRRQLRLNRWISPIYPVRGASDNEHYRLVRVMEFLAWYALWDSPIRVESHRYNSPCPILREKVQTRK